ncbi:hypothetical protein NE237_019197 [Protea cynaroides]|uniref:Pentatricopeptide repeat-containing protein n=1 Tax=Protea cynaroides TaxID=273540 RepID=A0A9Q0QPR5_9MAGN|nr:hypothetical protein NE237_019197 [Protea cynaroides]
MVLSLVGCARRENFKKHQLYLEKGWTKGQAEAKDFIKEMGKRGTPPDAITFNILINGYCKEWKAKKAFDFHVEILSKGIHLPATTYTALIYVLSKQKRMEEADKLFKQIRGKGICPVVIMFNALIDNHYLNGNMEHTFMILKDMDLRNVAPEEVTYNMLMQGLCTEGKVEEARELLNEMKHRGIKPDHISPNTLISGHSRKGEMKDAFKVCDEMFEPKMVDFDLAKYALYGHLTGSSDVYSYGIVLQELLSGKKAFLNANGCQTFVADWAWSLVIRGRALDVIEDDMPQLVTKADGLVRMQNSLLILIGYMMGVQVLSNERIVMTNSISIAGDEGTNMAFGMKTTLRDCVVS